MNELRLVELETRSSSRPRYIPTCQENNSTFYLIWYSSNFKCGNFVQQKALYARNSTKSLRAFVEASLKKQRTTYIDLLYLHWWDWDTSVEEVMRSLDVLVRRGTILYLVSFTFIFQQELSNNCWELHGVYLIRQRGSS